LGEILCAADCRRSHPFANELDQLHRRLGRLPRELRRLGDGRVRRTDWIEQQWIDALRGRIAATFAELGLKQAKGLDEVADSFNHPVASNVGPNADRPI